jgi:HK97 family phage prohead protease
MQPIYKSGRQSDADPFDFVLSTADVDRAGDLVQQNWELTDFRNNPIALYAHDHERPIGTWSKVNVTGGRLIGHLDVAEAGTSSFVDMLAAMVTQRILRAVSVGFQPLSREYRRDENENIIGFLFTKSRLLEGSLVSVPANQNALSLAKKLGATERECKAFFDELAPQGLPRTKSQRLDIIAAAMQRAHAALGSRK